MDRLRHWIGRLERGVKGEVFVVALQDGHVAKFSRRDMVAAYLELCSRTIGDPDTPVEEHTRIQAIYNSSNPRWRDAFSDLLDHPDPTPAEDLSGALARIPELEAPSEPRESPETATQEQEGVEVPLAERRSWWRKFFFGP